MVASPVLLPLINDHLIQKFPRRAMMSLPSNSLWEIQSGVVRSLTWREDGSIITLGIWGKGDVVGGPLATINPYQVECLTAVEAVSIPRDRWPQITEALIQHIRNSSELMEILHCKQLEQALFKLLVWLSHKFGQAVEQGHLINIRLTHQDLSELLGASRVTITRLLNELEKQELIQRGSQKFIVYDQKLPFWHYDI